MAGRVARVPAKSSATKQTAIVASSAHYNGAQAPQVFGLDEGWQAECYRFRSIIGEARYASAYYGHMFGKCELFVADPVVADGTRKYQPAMDSEEQFVLDDVFNGRFNQSQMLAAIGEHLAVGGECYVVGRQGDIPEGQLYPVYGDGTMLWEVFSPNQIGTLGKNFTIKFPGRPDLPLTEQDHVIRIWRPDPRNRFQADSPFKALLPVLSEIENLTKAMHAQLLSRLAGAGILLMPEGMELGGEENADGESQVLSAPSRLMKEIAEAGAVAIQDQGHPAARVPIILQVPDDVIDKAGKLIHFWSPLDEHIGPYRIDAIHRFALGMDLPPENIEGMSSNMGTGGGRSTGVSHWGAWQVEESSIKMHAEPGMEIVACAFTVDLIRVVFPETTKVVRYSTQGLQLRPDKSEMAVTLYQAGAISLKAMLRETGFDASDIPSDQEIRQMVLWKIATGSATPEMVAAANQMLGINLPLPSPAPSEASVPELPPPPSHRDLPERPRDPSERRAAALEPVCHAIVVQALARVGNRCIQRGCKPPEGVATYAVHTLWAGQADPERLLIDAFPFANELLDGIADPAEVMPVLQRYTASLVAAKAPHDRQEMRKWLERAEIGS